MIGCQWETDIILPDLQSVVLCEDVRCEVKGVQTLVGVLSVVPAPGFGGATVSQFFWTARI